MLISVILLSVFVFATAQASRIVPSGKIRTARSDQNGPTDPAELEAFMDDLIGKQMEDFHIAGTAVSVVKDGELIFAKGYGFADLENNIPVDPDLTVFRIGSVTKLFTWTALMQLVEQGKLDLDADINTYLDFRIPQTYSQPITLTNLLTHTDGFEEQFYEVLVLDASDMLPAGEWLVSHMPARVRPPGNVAAYSNYGTSLAGYIVERVSGKPYEQYIQENILDPLGMVNTTARSVVPLDLQKKESQGYTFIDGAFQLFPGYLGQPGMVPAGAMHTSATDIARFMIAHLQDGIYSDINIPEVRILNEGTAQQMHSTLFTHDPRLLGTAYGFFDFSDNGQRTIGHSGEADPMNALLLLLPDQNLGVFVVYNSAGGGELTNQHLGFQRAFFDHYFPAPAVDAVQPPPDFASQGDRFAGTYRLTRSSYTTFEKVNVLLGSTVAINNPGDGTLVFATPWGDWQFVEVEPLFFRQVEGPFGIVFREDDQGRITHLFTDFTPMFAFEKLQWYELPTFNMALLAVLVLIFLITIPVVLIHVIRSRRMRSVEQSAEPRRARLAVWIILAISVLNLLFVIGTVLWGNPKPFFGVSTIYKIVLGLGVLSALLTIGALVYTVLAWKDRYWGAAFSGYYTLTTVAALAFVWFLNNWNLLGWRF